MNSLEELKEKYSYHHSTPVMRQYLDVKFAHMDSLVLFRMGDFYELFFEDAVSASRVLGITLTRRGKTGEEEIPMCGVPYHALESYLHKLIEEGYRVAICDQLETPEEAKKRGGYKAVVTRNVTRIITPGTITEENLISGGTPNYLLSLVVDKDKAAICFVDLSTAEIGVMETKQEDVISQFACLNPKEILLSEKLQGSPIALEIQKYNYRVTYQVDSFFAENKCANIILNFYSIASLEAIGALTGLQVRSIGSILEYLSLTQKQHMPLFELPRIVNNYNIMDIDASARRNLEIVSSLSGNKRGSLLDVIDQTVTKAGGRLLYKFLSNPLTTLAEINNRLEITEFFFNNPFILELIRKRLHKTGDLERCLTRISMNRSTPLDLLSTMHTLDNALEIKGLFIEHFGLGTPDYISSMIEPLAGDEELSGHIREAIRQDAPANIADGGIINPGYHPKISELENLINNSRSVLEALKEKYRAETGIDSLKLVHNNVLGLFIEVTSKNIGKITGSKFIHRQTTANSGRYTTLELQKLESDMINARSLKINLERELYLEVCRRVIERFQILKNLASALAHLDVFAGFAHLAGEHNYTKPVLTDSYDFIIEGGRHPVIEKGSRQNRTGFISNDCSLSSNNRIWLITGPNMSGKSTFLRQNALIAILAQVGSFVPASYAKIGVVDKIFSRIGAGDDLLKNQSTFMVEMIETSSILAQATDRSLIILDEIGRGTSTYDGVAIAWSVLEHIHDKLRSRCLFATHYHELTSMSNFLPALENYTVAIDEQGGNILFLHRIIKGAADKSYGIHVAELAGLPKSVIARANEILLKLEKNSEKRNKTIVKSESNNLCLF